MELRISLFRHLVKLIEVIGCPAPEVVLNESALGKSKFVISFDVSKIPLPTCTDLRKDHHFFIGDHPHNSTVAEHRAVMSLKKFLEETFGFQIHDLSHSKIVSFELKMGHVVSSIKSLSNRLNTFIKQYQSSIKIPEPLLSFASLNCSSVFTGISESFSGLCNASQSSIDAILHELLVLDHEISLYCCIGPSTKPNNDIKDLLVCKICEKDFLSDILSLLDLSAAKYSAELTDGDLFTGTCSIDVGTFYGTDATGLINICGEPKTNPFDAESSAASHAITYLECTNKFDVVDFNYDSFVLLRQKHDHLLLLRSKYEALVSDASKSWSNFTSSFQSFIDHQYDLSSSLFFSTEYSSEYEGLITFASDLQEALYEILNMQQNALSVISSDI